MQLKTIHPLHVLYFETATSGTVQCISHELQGEWSGLGNVYGQIFSELGVKNKIPTGQNRKIYIHMDFENPAGNITEVQVGIL